MSESSIFTRPDPAVERSRRVYAALAHLAARHADTAERRARHAHPDMPSSDEVVRLVAAMAGGIVRPGPGEPELDGTDLVAALTLISDARADLDNVELALLNAARARGMTWQDIAFGLGLGTAQAAQQRCDRLQARTDDASGPTG